MDAGLQGLGPGPHAEVIGARHARALAAAVALREDILPHHLAKRREARQSRLQGVVEETSPPRLLCTQTFNRPLSQVEFMY